MADVEGGNKSSEINLNENGNFTKLDGSRGWFKPGVGGGATK